MKDYVTLMFRTPLEGSDLDRDAQHVLDFLKAARQSSVHMENLFSRNKQEIALDHSTLRSLLEKGINKEPASGAVFPELGYRLTLSNGKSSGVSGAFSFHLGSSPGPHRPKSGISLLNLHCQLAETPDLLDRLTSLFAPAVQIFGALYVATTSKCLLTARGQLPPIVTPNQPVQDNGFSIWSPGYMHYVTTGAQRGRLLTLGAERLERDGLVLFRLPEWDKAAYAGADLATPLADA